jgi:hypothetical protein
MKKQSKQTGFRIPKLVATLAFCISAITSWGYQEEEIYDLLRIQT